MNKNSFRPRILWVSPEAAPYASTGGLAEVAGAMPRRLHAAGWPVELLMPCYSVRCSTSDAPEIVGTQALSIEIAGKVYETQVLHAIAEGGLPLRMLRYDPFYRRPGIYADAGFDYPDNHLRFALLCKAACELAKLEDIEVLHLNDWAAALTAVFLATHYRHDPALAKVRVLQSIHNLAHPGCFETRTLEQLGLAEALGLWSLMGHQDETSWLKGGLLLADAIHTVSPRYAQEILTPEFGCGMDALLRLRSDRLHGVINGLDYEEWDPQDNKRLPAAFTVDDFSGKAICKQALLEEFGLKKRARRPLITFLGRMAEQKGLDLFLDNVPGLIAKDAQVLILGSGRADLQARCSALAEKYPGEVGVYIGFERSLAHRLLAGSDMVVMPSRFEPCGLTQMQAMRYGTIPIVHNVGGLADTVNNVTASSLSSGKATGFVFQTESTRALSLCLSRALKFYRDRRRWDRLMRNAMLKDLSWEAVLPGYESMYRGLFDYDPWRFGIELPEPGQPVLAEPSPFIDWGPELPARYHEDTIRLMVQSPTQIYVYWESLQGRHDTGQLRLRVDREGESWTHARGLNDVGDAWIDAEPARHYRVRLLDAEGRVLLQSNEVLTPRNSPSPNQEARWLEAEERRRRHLEASRRRAIEMGEEIPPWAYDEPGEKESGAKEPSGGSSDLPLRPRGGLA